MSNKNLLERMERAGFTLPKNKHSIHECKVGVSPKTGTTMFEDAKDRQWSWDRRESHFDVLTKERTYFRINEQGEFLDSKASTVAYVH